MTRWKSETMEIDLPDDATPADVREKLPHIDAVSVLFLRPDTIAVIERNTFETILFTKEVTP